MSKRREVPWHKVPTVPRPSQVPPPFTVFGRRPYASSSSGSEALNPASKVPARTHRRILFNSIPTYHYY
ncbi:hypothetical protein M8J76_015475 [Diaphorina citri]|nr:hypothetical protein M8J76_015475 [Diaphorina citri]KAI5747216.1 hypothetical protein M8J77_012392 [Diaphorina citri]